MYFFIFIIFLLGTIIISLFDIPATWKFKLDTNQNIMFLKFYWLYPVIFAKVEMQDYCPYLNVFLFKKQVYSKKYQLFNKSGGNQGYIHSLVLNDFYVNTSYGLKSPFSTGIASGIIEILHSNFRNISIFQYPDFLSANDYIMIDAGSLLNVGKTLLNIVRLKYSNNKFKRSNRYGTVQYG